ncbi:MAG: polysaccharide biosynthesis tyrosine autokinase [Candidatus Methylacidiphilales bacterium]|nr:polysaccharide biosynthesis tyrosine autokinase [Candidatus Methylacidiphilales bacterium]
MDPSFNAPAPQVMSSWSASFFTRMHRYKSLLRRRWWILALAVGLALVWQAYQIASAPVRYVSQSQMMVSPRISLPEKAAYLEESAQFFGTQMRLMNSPEIAARATNRTRTLQPDLPESFAVLRVDQVPKTSIFQLTATGSDPRWAQAWLNSIMEEFVRYKDEMRQTTSDKTLASITEQLIRLEKELEAHERSLFDYQKNNDVVVIQEQGNAAAQYLLNLEREQADLNKALQLLEMLTLDQRLSGTDSTGKARTDTSQEQDGKAAERASDAANMIADNSAEQEYKKIRQDLQLKKNELAELTKYLRPRHPKLINLQEEVSRQESLLSLYREQSMQQIKTHKEALQIKLANTAKSIEEWSAKAIKANESIAEYKRLQADVERTKSTYERMADMAQNLDMSTNMDQSTIQILERATKAGAVRPNVAKGLGSGVVVGLLLGAGILFLLDRIDDRVNSFTELKDHFEEQVLGQIPEEQASDGRRLAILSADDERQVYSEAFRNIRSSLLYMAIEGERPRVLAVTSAIPGEGKSTISLNLATTMAFAGSKVVLVDADMRKGVLHEDLEMESGPGLSQVLGQKAGWRDVIRPSGIPGLDFIPRGKTSTQVGEMLINPVTTLMIRELKETYDYVVIDTPPVLAADDTPSLSPKVDGVIMVMRASYTSSRLTRSSLDILYHRQVHVLGLVFNFIDTNLPDYYHYQYYRSYYNTPGKA